MPLLTGLPVKAQQPGTFVLTHALLVQASAVQAFLSSHSVADVQQPALAVLLQRPVASVHVSVVHGLVSAQSVSALQQPGVGV